MTTPHVGHLPLIALRPFFMTSSTASAISFFALHLTQYPSGINVLVIGLARLRRHGSSLRGRTPKRQLGKQGANAWFPDGLRAQSKHCEPVDCPMRSDS